ncbi:N-acetyllactosaminide beta-1,3-N-acetylglucosaminyltransferase 4-like [Branchiostoma floridae]|uniref:N-acetyllactosaminide beta-1,3-N-acetylglucosaminyltransferase 4-like n=2 Tax=Branchiostoma floridae TaxID=7739 RepID=A0A9J7HF89_BRAFL|nr:N-acetyllactosaminide beta-1,3-N-acetylglucosaminyltransferase 4-like [Branchiostoma floridae]XP_035658569.1 N-acetyllactosaminide beta-1,3-N-acetylglucosaminyltransferase 4-like [Branchiostoma floridae]XP_035658570.1 N-acetyllactosaminide beta-1,3-N-acetylglucosaminyltransferase 4-like [Branchiostoma floridae]
MMLSRMWSGKGKIGAMFNVVLVFSIVVVYHQVYLMYQQRGSRADRMRIIRSMSKDLRNNTIATEEKLRGPGNVERPNSNKDLSRVNFNSAGAKSKEVKTKVWPQKGSDEAKAAAASLPRKASSQDKENWQKHSQPGVDAKGKETKSKEAKVVPPSKPNPGVPAKPNPGAPVKPNPGAAKPNPGAAKPNPGAVKPNPGAVKPNPGAVKPNPGAPVKPNPGAAKPNPGAVKPNPGAVKPNPGAPLAANPHPLAPVNPHPYYFVIHHPYKCEERVFLLIIVTSSPQNAKQRQSIRQTWGNETNVPGVTIRTLFAIGKTNNLATQQALQQEDHTYHDIIQENFIDSYHNLTHKTIMCLKYAFKFCPNAKFLLKTDDDTFVNVFNLVTYLKELMKTKTERIVVGEVWREGKPIQEQRRKWPVPTSEYPRESYPKYPNGFAYVISNDITRRVYLASENIKNFFLEDVYIGLCLEKLGIDLIDNEHFYNYFVDIDPCRHPKLIASHWVKEPTKMVKLWNAARRRCGSS